MTDSTKKDSVGIGTGMQGRGRKWITMFFDGYVPDIGVTIFEIMVETFGNSIQGFNA